MSHCPVASCREDRSILATRQRGTVRRGNVTYCEPSLTGLGVYTMCPLTCTCRSFPCITAQPHTAIQNRFKDPHYSSSLTNHPSMTTSSCMQAKKAIKEVPKDDEEVDRQEEGDIDRGFTDSSSSSEDELTEAGPVVCKALWHGQYRIHKNIPKIVQLS